MSRFSSCLCSPFRVCGPLPELFCSSILAARRRRPAGAPPEGPAVAARGSGPRQRPRRAPGGRGPRGGAPRTKEQSCLPSACIIVSSGSPLVLPLPLTLYSTPSRLGMCSALGSTWAMAPGGGCAPPVVAPSSDGRTCGQIGQDRLGGFGVVIFLTRISAFRVYPATRLYYTAPLQCCTCTGSARTMDSSESESSI